MTDVERIREALAWFARHPFRVLGSLWPSYQEARCGCILRIHLGRWTTDPTNCDLEPHVRLLVPPKEKT